jgi:hypothetical protein
MIMAQAAWEIFPNGDSGEGPGQIIKGEVNLFVQFR